ncbi:MAG: glycosyltransferase, partial [Catenulispora sp.]|nr:glycosyltransferase [Catenulispora sp.]
MPRFSVIVPAYKVQAYLHECLDSVLSQSYPDLELIAVDDCSPDSSGAIIDRFAARDPRVRPLHLPANRGLGGARNAGMERASGDYLIFLDGDDTLTPHALRSIADRLKETGEPDVLVYDYARTYWSGETVRNVVSVQLTEQGPAPFRLEDRPGLLHLLMVAWNKACRREFVEREGFTFPPGYYEDTPWTFPVLMSAESLTTLDRVCVHYRQRRQGNILGTSSRKHFDIFEQYDRVFAFLDEHPELARWRPVLFRRMADHLTKIFAHRERLPRDSRTEFLRKARAHHRRYRVPGIPLPAPARLRHTLIRWGLHRTYRCLQHTAALHRRTAKLGAGLLRAARAAALRLHYRVQLRLPLHADRAVFSAHDGRGPSCHPGALEAAFRAHAPHICTAWIARPEHHHTVPAATGRVRPGTAAYWTALARSKYLVSNTGFERRLVKRRGQVLVQTQAGTPLGHMGLDLQEHPAAARDTDFGALLDDVDRWDYVLSANLHSTLTWERVFPGGYTTLEHGSPRNDVFQKATSADVARLRARLGVPEDSVAVLYAPSRRDYRRTQRSALDLERLLRRLGPRFVVLARTH